MFWKTLRLPFNLLGIPILIDLSLLIVLPLMAWLIGRNVPALVASMDLGMDGERLATGRMPYLLGLAAAVGLFVSVVIHELGHAVTGRLYGVRTRSITLWFLGGVAQFEEMPRQPWAEAVVAGVGPLTSLGVAAVCWGIGLVLPPEMLATRFIFAYLGALNLALAIFNLIPAMPMDGGRILRSILAVRLPYVRATRIAGSISRVLAVVMGLFGFLVLGNIFLVLIAFFVYMAASGEVQQSMVTESLKDMGVRELMTEQVKTVSPAMPVAELPQKMLQEGHLAFPVVEDGHIAGIVALPQLQGAPPEARVADIMAREVPTISINATALDAFKRMSQAQFQRLIVKDYGDRMAGIITKTDLIRAIRVRMIGMDMDGESAGFAAAQELSAGRTPA